MRNCKKCGSNEDKHVIFYEKGSDQPSKISLWTIVNGEHMCFGSLTIKKIINNIKLKPIYYCSSCNTVLPKQFFMRSQSKELPF
jgi:hypothetical protein